MTVIFRKELRQYFSSVRSFAIMAILLLFCGLYTAFQNLLFGSPNFSISLTGCFPALVLTLPLLCMHLFSRERKLGTEGFFYALALRPMDVVVGKFLAAFVVFLLPMLACAILPLLLSFFGSVNLVDAYFAWLGFLLLGASLLSIAIFLSALPKTTLLAWGFSTIGVGGLYVLQILLTSLPLAPWFSFAVIEAILLCACLLMWLCIGSRLAACIALVFPVANAILFVALPRAFLALFPRILSNINPFSRYAGFVYGRFDLLGILFFLSVTAFFLFCAVLVQICRRDEGV